MRDTKYIQVYVQKKNHVLIQSANKSNTIFKGF